MYGLCLIFCHGVKQKVIPKGVKKHIGQQGCAVSAHGYTSTNICNFPENEASEVDVDVVDKKVKSESKFPTGEVSVLPIRFPIIRPESMKIIGGDEIIFSGVEDSLQQFMEMACGRLV